MKLHQVKPIIKFYHDGLINSDEYKQVLSHSLNYLPTEISVHDDTGIRTQLKLWNRDVDVEGIEDMKMYLDGHFNELVAGVFNLISMRAGKKLVSFAFKGYDNSTSYIVNKSTLISNRNIVIKLLIIKSEVFKDMLTMYREDGIRTLGEEVENIFDQIYGKKEIDTPLSREYRRRESDMVSTDDIIAQIKMSGLDKTQVQLMKRVLNIP